MARLEYIKYAPHRVSCHTASPVWTPVKGGKVIEALPQIFWKDLSPWREANLWALKRSEEHGLSIKTVHSNFMALLAYANWLEQTETNWWDFPMRKADRCLTRYRGALIAARSLGEIAPSTASQRMAAIVKFYRWLYAESFLAPETQLWTNRTSQITISDTVGFERTIKVQSTDLAIPNRVAPGEKLEDGLLPVSTKDRDSILKFTKEHCSEELFLILTLGFYTGMRIGTIADLKIQTLERAIPDPACKDLYRLAVGPGALPLIHTKFDTTGQIWITRVLLDSLLTYAYSVRRLNRESKSTEANKNLLFLTKFGNPYVNGKSNSSKSINVEMHNLRKLGSVNGISSLRNFHFHQARCTFATELASLAIQAGGVINAISIVKDALLHKNEATSLRYIKFIEKKSIKSKLANEFTMAFLDILSANDK